MIKSPTKPSRDADSVMQDGTVCPKIAPWGRHVGIVTGIPYLVIAVLGGYILERTSPIALLVWFLLLLIFAVPLRYLICARCPYYGQPCCTLLGIVTPRLFQKQEGRSMKAGLWLDMVFFLFLFGIPLPYAWLGFGWPMALLWTGAIVAGFLIHTRFGCARCPFTFCPIGKVGRVVWHTQARQTGPSEKG